MLSMPQVFEQSQFLFPPDFDLALVFVTPKFTESPRLRWGCVYQWPPVNRSAFEQWMPKPQSVPGMGEKEEGGGNKGGKKNEIKCIFWGNKMRDLLSEFFPCPLYEARAPAYDRKATAEAVEELWGHVGGGGGGGGGRWGAEDFLVAEFGKGKNPCKVR